MKNLQILKGAKALTKKEQQSVNGGSLSQWSCESSGGIWVCVGAGNCGCVVGIKPTQQDK